jgi:hypothetical protein
MSMPGRRYRAGESIEDYCRACKTDRMHTVVAADPDGRPIRVDCGYCHSEHNYRGGGRIGFTGGSGERSEPAGDSRARSEPRAARPGDTPLGAAGGERARQSRTNPLPARQRTRKDRSDDDSRWKRDLEMLLRRVIREETGITAVAPAEKWRGGTLVLRPGTPGVQDKSWPIETFFHKVVMLRNRLRTLEQQVNAADLPDDAKVKMQGYISGCYGSLTSFNVLFADEDDQFKGSGGD